MKAQPFLMAGLVLLALALNNHLAQRVKPDLAAPVGMNQEQQTKLEQVASASLFGQFRSNLADFLWMKVDKYLHSGVDLRGLTEEEKKGLRVRRVNHVASENASNRAHYNETTIVLSVENDWRGVMGSIERDVKPFMDMRNHTHRDPKEALPLFRLMTWSNPHFIPGYAVGAAMIAREEKAFDAAVDFIREGEKNNPESIEIQATYSWLLMHGTYFNGRNDYKEAARHAELGVSQAKLRDAQTLSEDEMTAWQECVRWRVLAYRELGDLPAGTRAAQDGLKYFPQDVSCRKFLADLTPARRKTR